MPPNKIKESYQMLKSKFSDIKSFLDKPKWKNRLLYYFIILLPLAAIAWLLWNTNFTHTLWTNNAYTQYNATQLRDMGFYDNERYLLSTLVQSLAATIALVITLSLVAVQLAAQSYSARVIDVYKKNPDMWILLCIYIITIFYGLGLTKIIGLGILGNFMESAIFVAYFMGFFAFICLVPYMLKTLDLLKPSTVIKLLAEEITKKNILNYLELNDEVDEIDPIQPTIDIMNNALARNDYETVKNGCSSVGTAINYILQNEKFENRDESKFSIHVSQHLKSIGLQAISNNNENSGSQLISTLKLISLKATEKNHDNTAMRMRTVLWNIGTKTADKKYGILTNEVIEALGENLDKVIKMNQDFTATNAVWALQEVAKMSAENKLEGAAQEAAAILCIAAEETIEQEKVDIALLILDAIKELKIIAIENNLESVLEEIQLRITSLELN